jgi:hypothetical protein
LNKPGSRLRVCGLTNTNTKVSTNSKFTGAGLIGKKNAAPAKNQAGLIR